jgi:DNA-binding MarR family transcriptional regulator
MPQKKQKTEETMRGATPSHAFWIFLCLLCAFCVFCVPFLKRINTMDLEARLHTDHANELRLWLRMLTCTQLIERNVRTALREKFDTTLPRFDLMAQLERAPQGLKMNELSRRLMVTGGNITGITDQLVNEGLVERLPVEGDRRAYLVRLTAAGHASFAAMAHAHEAWIVQAFEGLGSKDIVQLHKLLGRVKDSAIAMNLMTDTTA